MNAPAHFLQQRAYEHAASEPVNAHSFLRDALRGRLPQWFHVPGAPGFAHPDSDKFAWPKVTAIVAIYDDALARLEKKTGARADTAREQLRAAREPLAAKLDLVNSIRADFGGPLGLELQQRVSTTRLHLRQALAAKELANSSKIEAALLDVEKAWASIRELSRDLDSINERLIVPWKTNGLAWPDLAELESAERSTAALESVSAKQVRAAHVHAAIEQGIKAPAHVAALWIAYESNSDHELLKWRWRAYAERA
jgi:hypothetical protein